MPLVTEKWSGRRGRFDYRLQQWVSGRVYEISQCADEFTARAALANLSPAITVNCAHPLNKTLVCTSLEFRETGFNFFTADAAWTIPNGGDATASDDPLSQPLEIDWEPALYSEASEIDAENDPMVNMAGDPFPALPMDRKTVCLVVKKWQPYYDVVQATTYMGAINSDQFTIDDAGNQQIVVPAGECRCESIKPEGPYTLHAKFAKVIYRFSFRPNNTASSGVAEDAWDIRLVNQGYQGWYTDPATNKPARGAFYLNGERVTEPVLLDATGVPIQAGVKVTRAARSPICNPYPPTVNKQVWLETQTLGSGTGSTTVVFCHYLRGQYLPFTGLV